MASIAIAAGLMLILAIAYPALWPAAALAKAGANQASQRVEKFSISGESAFALWTLEDEEDEEYTEVFVSLLDRAIRDQEQSTSSFVDIAIYQYKFIEECDQYGDEEYCYYYPEYSTEFFGFAELEKSAFKIANNLNSATAQDIEIVGFDYASQEEMTIVLDAEWTGIGPLTRTKESFTDFDEFFKYTVRFSGASRNADATAQISGDIEMTLNDTFEGEARLASIKEGTMIRFFGKPSPSGDGHGWRSLIAPIAELQNIVDELEEQIDSLEERVSELEERIDDGGSSDQDIFVEINDIVYGAGDNVVIQGKVGGDENDEVDITIEEAGGGGESETVELDDDGGFEFTYTVPSNPDDGVYIVEVQFETDDPIFTYFIVDEENDDIEVITDDDTYEPGDDVVLSGTVDADILESGVDEVEITVLDPTGDDIVSGEETVIDSNGDFEYELELDDGGEAQGRYAVIVSYDGAELGWTIYQVESTSGGANEITAALEDSTLSPGDEVVIVGSIEETDVEPGEELVLEVFDPNDVVIFEDFVEPDADGFFSFAFDLEDDAESGMYELTLQYAGYEDKSLTFTVSS
jgi:hypothetical protein